MNQEVVCYSVQGNVAVVAMDRSPLNTLDYPLRVALLHALGRASQESTVQAIVLTGTARAFSTGHEISEFETPDAARDPSLNALIRAVEESPKPVVAAIAGLCLGAGLELALGAHFRVAHSEAKLGLPDVRLGLVPGNGGTQRLPRLAGIDVALNMIVTGGSATASKLEGSQLLDRVVDGDVVSAARAFAEAVISEGRSVVRTRDMQVADPHGEAFLAVARNGVATGKEIALRAVRRKSIELVAASLSLRFEEGLQAEREAFLTCVQTPESRALRHIFKAERDAQKIEGLPEDAALRKVHSVGIVGAGTMGGGIAMNFVNAGIPVVLLETQQAPLDRGMATIRRNYENSAKKGKLTLQEVDERMALITPTLDYVSLANVDLVIEAVFEELSVKEQVFRRLDQVCRPGAILASNTSFLNVDEIALFTNRPADVLGLHFFSPANVMRLLEVVRGARTAPDVLATCLQLGRQIGKVAVVSGVCDGFIGNRMLEGYGAAAAGLINAGALPQQVDGALQKFGLAMGPFRMGDLAGLDIGWATRKRRAAEAGIPLTAVISDKLCEAGRFGQKTGAGWYRYEEGKRDPMPDPVAERIIAEYLEEHAILSRTIADEEVIERCIFALVNQGARILEEGIAARASDIDLVYLNGYGFPAHRGGPMFYADTVGLNRVVEALRRFAEEPGAGPWWQPAPLLISLADEGRTFN